jgi:hypothetical protein
MSIDTVKIVIEFQVNLGDMSREEMTAYIKNNPADAIEWAQTEYIKVSVDDKLVYEGDS